MTFETKLTQNSFQEPPRSRKRQRSDLQFRTLTYNFFRFLRDVNLKKFCGILQSEDSDVEVKDDSMLVAQQGEQDAATATIMATVDPHEGTVYMYLCI